MFSFPTRASKCIRCIIFTHPKVTTDAPRLTANISSTHTHTPRHMPIVAKRLHLISLPTRVSAD